MAIVYRGERFSGYNKPKRTPKHPKKSHAVLAKQGEKIRLEETNCMSDKLLLVSLNAQNTFVVIR